MFHVKHARPYDAEEFSESDFRLATGVSRETLSKLSIYVNLLKQWQKQINLVSSNSLGGVWCRHIFDSAQIFSYIANQNQGVLDLGSGAGFPGLVLSIMGTKNVVLIESSQKKCSFLREVVRQTACDAKIFNGRVEEYPVLGSSYYVTSRALAPMETLFALSYPLLSSGGRCLFLKGKNYEHELTRSQKKWSMDFQVHRSKTDQSINMKLGFGVLLEIWNLLPCDQ